MSEDKNFFDPKFIDPFVDATKLTLGTQAKLQITNRKGYVKTPGNFLANIAVAGVIHVDSDKFKGAIALCFQETTFLKIYERMVGEVHATITSEVKDAAGEILNIIFGNAKAVITTKLGFSLGLAIPTVLAGKEISVSFKSNQPTIVLPFESEFGEFYLEIIVDIKAAQKAA